MDDCREKRRRRCTKLTCSTDNIDIEKMMHRETERQRRQEMASLYASLRSLLPLHFIQGKRSTSDQVNEAVNYIKYLQRKNEELSSRRDELMLVPRGRLLGSSSDDSKEEMDMIRKNHVVVRQCLVGVEIMFSTSRCCGGQPRFSSVLQVLSENGFSVLNSISSIFDDRLVYTIQAERKGLHAILSYLNNISRMKRRINDMALIELAELEERLIRMK